MSQLAARDLNDVLAVGRTALECDNLQDLQEKTFHLMEDCVGSSSAVYLGISGNDGAWNFESGLTYGVPNEGLRVWCANYQDVDPFVARFLEKPANDSTVVVSSEIMPNAEFVRTKFYREFLQPQSIYHVMVLGLVKHGRPIGVFGLHRRDGAPAFSKKEVIKANLLSPYLSAAVQKIRASDRADERELIIDALAADNPHTSVVILDSNGIPICDFGNAADLLQRPPGAGSAAGPLELPGEIIKRCEQMKRTIGGQDDSEFREEFNVEQPGGELLNVRIRPHDCGAQGLRFLVYLGTGEAGVIQDEQLNRFKLTTRQIDIVKLVSLGMTNPEISDRLCISARTVQNHLRSIYIKVNVHNRTSLVSKLARR